MFSDWRHVALSVQEIPKLNFVEFFAGDAQCFKMFKCRGFSAARLDIIYMGRYRGSYEHENPMDLTTAAGMGNLGCRYKGHNTLCFYCFKFNLVVFAYHGISFLYLGTSSWW